MIVIGIAGSFWVWMQKTMKVMEEKVGEEVERKLWVKTVRIEAASGTKVTIRNTGNTKILTGELAVLSNETYKCSNTAAVDPDAFITIDCGVGVAICPGTVKVSAPGGSDSYKCA